MSREQWLMTACAVLVMYLIARVWWVKWAQAAAASEPDPESTRTRVLYLLPVLAVVVAFVAAAHEELNGDLFDAGRWLISLALLAAAWLALRVREYRRGPSPDAAGRLLPFPQWLDQRFHEEWPILAVFMLGPTIGAPAWVMIQSTRPELVLLLPAAVLVWWLVEWRGGLHEHPLRNPLRLLWDGFRGLWRNRLVLVVLVACWLVSGGLSWTYMATRFPEVWQRSLDLVHSNAMPVVMLASTMSSPGENLPRITEVPTGYHVTPLLALTLAGWFIWLVVRRPRWLPAPVRERLTWPTHLLIGAAAISLTYLVVMSHGSGTGFGSGSFWFAAVAMLDALLSLVGALFGPLDALLYGLVLRIVGGRPWGMRQATRVTAYCWGSIVGLLVVWYAIRSTPYLVGAYRLRPNAVAGDVLTSAYGLALVALALAPWLIVDRRMRLWPALSESWRLVRARAVDVLVFAVRFWLVMTLAATLLSMASETGVVPYMLNYLLGRTVLGMLRVLMLAGGYLALQRSRPAATRTHT